jgi:hypothetical protein
MGSSASKEATQPSASRQQSEATSNSSAATAAAPTGGGGGTNTICENCDKKTQVERPPVGTVNDDFERCQVQYGVVDECMKSNLGRVSKCVAEWDAFKLCHGINKPQQE